MGGEPGPEFFFLSYQHFKTTESDGFCHPSLNSEMHKFVKYFIPWILQGTD